MKQGLVWMTMIATLVLTACGSGASTTGSAAPTAASVATSAPEATTAPTTAAAEATVAPTNASAAAEATAAPTTAAGTDATAAPTTAAGTTAAAQTYAIVPDQSKVTYEVGEVFFNDNNRFNVAVGTTQQVSGTIMFDSANPQNSKVGPLTIDISTFQTDSGRRDNAIRDRWLESSKYPIAEFTPTQIDGLPASYTPGQEVTFQMSGDLKVREVTKTTTFTVTGKLENNMMTGTANTQIKMSDFGFEAPDIGGMLKAEDDVKIKFEFVAKP